MGQKFEGNVWLLGDDVDTDAISPQRASFFPSAVERAKHCLLYYCPEFAPNAKPGDVIVAGKNFGCGSSREYAPEMIKGCGVTCIIAKSFARIFYRNAINEGILLIESDEVQASCKTGDAISVTPNESFTVSGITYPIRGELPPRLTAIYEAGGLVEYNRRINRAKKGEK